MQANKEQYKKLYVLSPEYYDKLQKQQVNLILDKPLDQMLFKILKNNQSNVYKKWLMYKNALLKFRQSMIPKTAQSRPITTKIEQQGNVKNISFATPHFKKVIEKEPSYMWDFEQFKATPIQIKPRKNVTFSKSTPAQDMFSEYRKQRDIAMNSTTDDSSIADNNISFDEGDIPSFDSTKNSQLNDNFFEYNPDQDNDDDDIEENIKQENLEEKLLELAKHSFKEKNENNILRLDDTLDDDHRVFENRKTRDLIAIEVNPVKEHLENDIPLRLNQEEAPRTDVEPIVQNIDEFTSREYQPKLIRLAQLPVSNQTKTSHIELRNRDVKRRRSGSLAQLSYRTRPQSKKSKKTKQPQQGSGINFSWASFKQKKI